MPIYIDPVTRQRIIYDKRSGDIVYNAVGDTAITNQDVPITQARASGGVALTREKQLNAGTQNELWGTEPQIENNEHVPNLTERGVNEDTHVTQQIIKYVDLKNGN
jgi:hypothetical protein